VHTAGKLSSKRLPTHHYSTPGTYHLLLETAEDRQVLGTMRRGVMMLNTFGQVFLAVLGYTLQRFPCASIKAMDIQPSFVEMVVVLTGWRLKLRVFLEKNIEWFRDRRTMVIPLLVGYAKMNSGRRINVMNGVCNQHVWTLRYKAAFLTDEQEIAALCAELDARFQRMRLEKSEKADAVPEPRVSFRSAMMAALGGPVFEEAAGDMMPPLPEQGFDSMLLGRAFFLSGAMLRPLPEEGVQGEGDRACGGGRARVPLICSIGPGKIFLTGPEEN